MISDIYPTTEIQGKTGEPVTGFYLGKVFIPMKPHKGHVALLPTKTGKGCGYRFVKEGNNKNGVFSSTVFELKIQNKSDPISKSEILEVATSENLRLVVLNNHPQFQRSISETQEAPKECS